MAASHLSSALLYRKAVGFRPEPLGEHPAPDMTAPDKDTTPANEAAAEPRKPLTPAAERALAEAAERRKAAEAAAARPAEVGGRDGPEPTRYGDWEKSGIASDF